MAAGYSIPESDALGMLGDAHSTNYAENRDFFLNQNNPTNFERTWTHRVLPLQEDQRGHRADAVRSGDGLLGHPEAGRRAEVRQPEERVRHPVRAGERRHGPGREGRDPHQDGRDPLLPELVGPQQEDHAQRRTARKSRSSTIPNVGFVVEEVGKLAGQYGAARIVIEGHTDGSMKASGAEEPGAGAVAEPRELGEGSDRCGSSRRCSPTSSRRPGMGWDRPADPSDPDNNAKNRRVEIKVYPAEAAPAAK